MNILLLSRYFPPEIGTAANLFFEMAKGLAEKRHKVTVVTNFPWYNLETIPDRYRGKFFMKENIDGVEVVRLALPIIGTKKIKLAVGHLTVPFTSFFGGLLTKRTDVIFFYSPPLFMGIAGWLLKLFKRVPTVMGVQDLHPQCYIDQGVLRNKLVIYFLETLERFCYKRSTLITVHSNGNKEHIINKKRIEKNKVKILQNWIDTDNIQPLPRDNEFSGKHDLNRKFVVGYAGTLGMSQGLLSLIDTANLLKGRESIEFFIVGDGIEKQRMLDRVKEFGLKNVRFLEMQSKSVYPYVVASSDVSLVTLNSKVKTPVVPSKILSIMAMARPVLASLPMAGDASKLIEKAGCGICIGPEDPEKLAEKIMYLYENRDVCNNFGDQGRKYVVNNFSLKKAVNDIENMFDELILDN